MLKTTSIRGLKTAWLQQGEGDRPIVMFLHGCPDSPQTWSSQFEHYADQGYSALAPYARGLGESAPASDSKRYGRDAIALDNLAILRTVDPKGKRKVVVVGHDIGAIHAWKLARLLGPRLGALILVNGPDLSQMALRISNPRQVLKSWYIALFQLPLLPELLLSRGEAALLARARRKGGMPDDETHAIRPFLEQYRQAGRELPRVLLTKETPLKAPVLVLWGKDDAFLEVPSQSEFDALASDVTIRVVEGNHWLHSQQPARVNSFIDRFLEEKL